MKKIKTYNIGKATTFDLNQLSSDLEPGKYTIKTQAISVNGKESKESIGVEYEVKDPLNPLGLPPFTIRIKFKSGYTPTMGDSQTLVDTDENVWDIYKNSTDWTSLFEKNSKLVEVLGANTSSCTNMSYMFNYCTALTTVPLFDTSSCTNMSYMFQNCSSLTTVPLFDTSSCTNMSYMFYSCIALTTVPLFDTSSCTDMSRMFNYCTALTTVPLFDTSSCTNMSYMFNYCNALTTVPLFNTSSCTDMSYMFYRCRNVQSGALALYQQASTQATPPSSHSYCFSNCGSNTVTGAAELAQIPASWGGTMA